jgi:hypothetical protein
MANANRAPVALAFVLSSALVASGLAAGCGAAPLATPPAGDPGVAPQSLAIPADVGAPVLSCGGGVGAVSLQLPCLLGMAPVSEVDCGLAGAPTDQRIRFALGASLPDNPSGQQIVLGQATRFDADLLPYGPSSTLEDGKYKPTKIMGTVVFTKLSPADATFDGWFPHLDFVWSAADGSTVSCALDKGRFTAVPGGYL